MASIANTTIVLRKSGTPGASPSSLANGELALNYADGKLYYKSNTGSILAISGSGGGGSLYSFATINANSSLILATSPTDTLSIIPGNNITITANTTSKSIAISLANNVTISGNINSVNSVYANALIANSYLQFPDGTKQYTANASSGSGTSANNFLLYNFPLGNYGLVTQSIYGGLGNEQIGDIFDMRAQPPTGGIAVLDCGYLV
jgi:hypothetical protein